MSIQGFSLGDKVKTLVAIDKYYKGTTGVITSLIWDTSKPRVIGVNLDGDHFNPTPYYFKADELEKLK